MDFSKVKRNFQFKPSSIVREEDETPVQNGQAMTPAQAMEMAQMGVPISNSNLQLMEVYKTSDKDFTVPMEFRRNVDMADMYQHRKDITSKVKSAQDSALSNLKSQVNAEQSQ